MSTITKYDPLWLEQNRYTLTGQQCEELDFIWMEWGEGVDFIQSRNWDLSDKDQMFCKKLLTAIVRNDRFCDGYLDKYVEEGLVGRLVERST